MKKQKIKKIFRKHMIPVLFLFFTIGTVFGSFTSYDISSQSSTLTGSNSSIISFSGAYTSGDYINNGVLTSIVGSIGTGSYVNNGDNSAIIGNYFKGYYYDSLYGYFKLDWSSNTYDNVRVIGSTTMCPTGYGYKLGGKAYSEVSGYINFNHSFSRFVYYCLDDKKLHGYAYGKYIGYQNFEGIEFSFVNDVVDLFSTINDTVNFGNDSSIVNVSSEYISEELEMLGGEIIQINPEMESIFYIIK